MKERWKNKLIKTILVDDDVEFLEGLLNTISWKALGFEIIGVAENGIKAFEIINNTDIDLLIVDITMPGMDGIELIDKSKKNNRFLKTIILTCHEDFEYAKNAIKLNVDEYMVKYTLTKEELEDTLEDIKKQILEENRNQKKLLQLDRQVTLLKKIGKENFFKSLLNHKILSINTLNEKANLFGIQLYIKSYQIISLYIDNYEEIISLAKIKEQSIVQFTILNIANEIFNENRVEVFFLNKDQLIVLKWKNDEKARDDNQFMYKLTRLQKMTKSLLEIPISICISSFQNNIMFFNRAITEVNELRDEYFYDSPMQIISEMKKKFVSDKMLNHEISEKYTNKLRKIIRTLQRTDIEKLDEIFNKIKMDNIKPYYIRRLGCALLFDIEKYTQTDVVSKYNRFEGYTFFGIKQVLHKVLEDYMNTGLKEDKYKVRTEIVQAIEYIEMYLGKSISCQEIAKQVNMNKDYFSRLFKKEIGQSFTDYLMEKRIEKATLLLLQTDYSIEEISRLIGLENPSYFYRLYKKKMGKTPGSLRGINMEDFNEK